MPSFSYVAVDKKGHEKKGIIDAMDRTHAIELLKGENLTPVSVKEQSGTNININFSFKPKITPRDLSVLCRQFVSIIQAGIPLKEALQMLSEQTEKKVLREALLLVLAEVEKGNTLSESMRTQQHIFPGILIDMVAAGELSGSLDVSFSRMAVQFEKEAKLRATIKKATVYPIILVIACIGVIAVMLLFVIPQFISMFADIDMEMPAFTMAVMNASKWLGKNWYIVAIIIAGIIFGFRMIYQTPQGRLVIDRIKMRLPLFGKLQVKSICAQMSRTIGTLISTGIPMIDCLEVVSKIVGNIHYTNALLAAREEVMQGTPLSETLKKAGIFPPMVYHMTGIGEETGNMEDMLEKLADYYDEEVEITTQAVMAAMEPAIIVVMALIVGVLIFAVISPIGTMYDGLDKI